MKGIRLYSKTMDYEVCPHISINAEPDNKKEECEYSATLKIRCKICEKYKGYEVLIN